MPQSRTWVATDWVNASRLAWLARIATVDDRRDAIPLHGCRRCPGASPPHRGRHWRRPRRGRPSRSASMAQDSGAMGRRGNDRLLTHLGRQATPVDALGEGRRTWASAYGRPARVLNTIDHCDGMRTGSGRGARRGSDRAALLGSQSAGPNPRHPTAAGWWRWRGRSTTWSETRGMPAAVRQMASHRLEVDRDAWMQAHHPVRATAERPVGEVHQRQRRGETVGRRPGRQHLAQGCHSIEQLIGVGRLVHLAHVARERGTWRAAPAPHP